MLYRHRFILLVLLLLTTMPAVAAERVDTLPAIKEFTAVRFEIALFQNGRPSIVGKGELTNANRAHFVLKTLPSSGLEPATVELVTYDGTVYSRMNDSTQWYIEGSTTQVGPPNTSTAVSDVPGTLSLIGPVDVAGTPTNQYQVWMPGSSGEDHTALDMFIGQQASYLYQLQLTAFTGADNVALTYRFYSFDDGTISVAVPAGAIRRTSSLPSPLKLASYHGPLSTLAVPLGALAKH